MTTAYYSDHPCFLQVQVQACISHITPPDHLRPYTHKATSQQHMLSPLGCSHALSEQDALLHDHHFLINSSSSFLIFQQRSFSSNSQWLANAHLELFIAQMTYTAPITIRLLSRSLPFTLSVYILRSVGTALKELAHNVPGSYSLLMHTSIQPH